jgi:hypothetical protein
MIRKHFRIRRIVLGLAVAAIAVPVAQAKPVDYQVRFDQPISPAQISLHGGVTPTLAQLEAEAQRMSARSYQQLSDTPQSSIHGGITPTMAQLETQAQQYRAKIDAAQGSPAVLRSDRFDWSDAGIGGAAAFGAALVLLMSVGVGRRYRSRLDGTGLAST